MSLKFNDFIKSKEWILTDGAMGTNLFEMGLSSGDSPELWNETEPTKVKMLHKSFVEAGSEIILTNSFGANSSRLKLHGAGRRAYEISKVSAELAREIADQSSNKIAVAGSIGPTGEILSPIGDFKTEFATEIFHEQAEGLRDGGVDVLWLETISSEEEFRAAATAFANFDLAWCGTMSFDTSGRTMMGITSSKMATLVNSGVCSPLAFGANCGAGAADLVRTVQGFSKTMPYQPIIAKGNAGIPKYVDGKIIYNGTPSLMGEYAVLARDSGAKIIGGCCGTTDSHIRAMKKALEKTSINKMPSQDQIIAKLGNFTSAADGTDEVAKPKRIKRNRPIQKGKIG